MPSCKECNLVFYSSDGLMLHVEKAHGKTKFQKLESHAWLWPAPFSLFLDLMLSFLREGKVMMKSDNDIT